MVDRASRAPYDRTVARPTLRRFRALVAYDGTAYAGWQTQQSGSGVQDVLETRLSKLFGGRVYVAGSGRTDKGVHAKSQLFHFDVPEATEPGCRPVKPIEAALEQSDATLAAMLEQILAGPTSGLPIDVQVLKVATAPPGFHARDSCVGKRYVYTVQEGAGSPDVARYRWVLGRGKRLDVERMAEAAAILVGDHDFSTFGVIGEDDPRSPLKRMRRLEVRRIPLSHPLDLAASSAGLDAGVGLVAPANKDGFTAEDMHAGAIVTICAECDRFLYNMMRLISGTLVQVGLGKLSVDDVHTLLAAKGRDGTRGGPKVYKAPPQGLCLEYCFTSDEDGCWTSAMPRAARDAGGQDTDDVQNDDANASSERHELTHEFQVPAGSVGRPGDAGQVHGVSVE